jgi:hypothetical protein
MMIRLALPRTITAGAMSRRSNLPGTDRFSRILFDMRLPLTFSLEDCRHIAAIIAHCAAELGAPA